MYVSSVFLVLSWELHLPAEW